MNRNDFILPVSMIKVQEKKLLSEDRLIKMLETNSFKEILRILNDKLDIKNFNQRWYNISILKI